MNALPLVVLSLLDLCFSQVVLYSLYFTIRVIYDRLFLLSHLSQGSSSLSFHCSQLVLLLSSSLSACPAHFHLFLNCIQLRCPHFLINPAIVSLPSPSVPYYYYIFSFSCVSLKSSTAMRRKIYETSKPAVSDLLLC